MAGAHIDLHHIRAGLGRAFAQAGGPFGGLPIGDAWVGQAAGDQHGRIGFVADIVVGRIGRHDFVVFGAGDRVAPFHPFRRGQRQAGVRHRVHHIDEGHFGDEAREQLRRLVRHGAHQHAARRTALRHDAAFGGVIVGDEVLSAVDEVVKGVLLLGALAVEIPLIALVGAAADMRDHIDEAAIHQRQAHRRKRRGQRVTV